MRWRNRSFTVTCRPGSNSAPIASIILAMPFSGKAARASRFRRYLPWMRTMGMAPLSGSSEKKSASTPKSLLPSTMPSSTSSSVRSPLVSSRSTVLATRNVNAADRRRCSSAPSPSSVAKESACLSTMPLIRWSMICAAREAIRTSRHAGTTSVVNPDPYMRLRLASSRSDLSGGPGDATATPCGPGRVLRDHGAPAPLRGR